MGRPWREGAVCAGARKQAAAGAGVRVCDRYCDRGGAGVRFGDGDAKRDGVWLFELATMLAVGVHGSREQDQHQLG